MAYDPYHVWIPGTVRVPVAAFRGVEPGLRLRRIQAVGSLRRDGEVIVDDILLEWT